MSTAAQTDPTPSWAELQRRLIFTLLRPAMRLCHLFRLPLSTVEELSRMAYFEEVRFHSGHSQTETAALMNRSLRTIGNLEKQYRSDFLAPEAELELVRRVEELFSADPLTLADAHAHLAGVDPADVERIVFALVALDRLEVQPDSVPQRFALNRDFVSLLGDDLDGQMDGLRHQLDVILNAIRGRFVRGERGALARTLSFVASTEDMEELGADLIRHLRTRCIDVEERALRARRYNRFAVTFAMAPMDPDDPR